MAQDAAVDHQRVGGRREPRGVFCLAVASPTVRELTSTVYHMKIVGKTKHLPIALGGHHALLLGLENEPLHGRTRMPATWFQGALLWTRVLARRFYTRLEIAEAELRSVVMDACARPYSTSR